MKESALTLPTREEAAAVRSTKTVCTPSAGTVTGMYMTCVPLARREDHDGISLIWCGSVWSFSSTQLNLSDGRTS